MQEWVMARPEMRDFLQSRPMVPYTEAWMPQVDTMKTLQGWSDVTVTHFRSGVFGAVALDSLRRLDRLNDGHAELAHTAAEGKVTFGYRAATGAIDG
jgi:hypothetical protein